MGSKQAKDHQVHAIAHIMYKFYLLSLRRSDDEQANGEDLVSQVLIAQPSIAAQPTEQASSNGKKAALMSGRPPVSSQIEEVASDFHPKALVMMAQLGCGWGKTVMGVALSIFELNANPQLRIFVAVPSDFLQW